MKNYNLIEAKYKGPTNARGSRVLLFSPRFGSRKTIAYNYSKNDIGEMAIDYLKEQGFNVLGKGEAKEGYYIVTDTFQDIK